MITCTTTHESAVAPRANENPPVTGINGRVI
jgi:hypothetical protein